MSEGAELQEVLLDWDEGGVEWHLRQAKARRKQALRRAGSFSTLSRLANGMFWGGP